MSERKFTKGLGKPGMAAQLRETVSQVVRERTCQNKLHVIDPVDFEAFITKAKTLIFNDSHRELLLYPSDDISQVTIPRDYRTILSTVPKEIPDKLNMLTKECMKTYSSDWNFIHYKYSAYSGSYFDLPCSGNEKYDEALENEVYEMDIEIDQMDKDATIIDGLTKEGYLMKGPEVGSNDRIMFSNIGSKSFKRRFCHLRQQIDGTYVLEFSKDEKKTDVKIANLDFCTEIVRNTKRGKYCFELKMTGPHKSYFLAADSESELQDWVTKLNAVLQHYKLQEEKYAAWLAKAGCDAMSLPQPQSNQIFGTLKGLEQSMNPQLMRYSQETDASIASDRKKKRRGLFRTYLYQCGNKFSLLDENNSKPYKEEFDKRIFIKCENITFKLQFPIDENESLCQVEPYFTTLSVFDAKKNQKLCENFHFDVNHEFARQMITRIENSDASDQQNALKSPRDCIIDGSIESCWLNNIKQAVFNISEPHPDIFIVVRIDKILQGNVHQIFDAYVRAAKDPRLGTKIQKQMQAYFQRLGNYRMPFAWSAKPLFKLYSNELDTSSDFPAIYRQDGNKIKDEDLLKLLLDYRKPDKFNKLTIIPGWIKIKIEEIAENPANTLTTSLEALKPFPIPPTSEITLEIAEFDNLSEKSVHPYTTCINNLYVYPQCLAFDTQKIFNRARNIVCFVEMRDDDVNTTQPLKCIYGRLGSSLLISKMSCPVLHHNATPSWYEEIKIRLPLQLGAKHHLLFTFYHISCDVNKKKEGKIESCIGYSWLPLLNKGRFILTDSCKHVLPVATDLPDGYLSIQSLGLGKGNAGPEISWIDSQKPIFTVSLQIHSTVLTNDINLHNVFAHFEKLMNSMPISVPSDSETCKILKSAQEIRLGSVVKYLPTILNQLFALLTTRVSDEVGQSIVKLLVHIVNLVHEAGRREILLTYVKFVFPPINKRPHNSTTVHEQLVKYLSILLSPNNADSTFVCQFVYHSGLFFNIIIKSMAQYLFTFERIKMSRCERFSKDYEQQIEGFLHMVVSYIESKCKDAPFESQTLNKSCAQFLKRCLTFMDRGFIFKMINLYTKKLSASSARVLHDLKFKFLQIICSHEHYIIFNLPLMQPRIPSKDENGSAVESKDLLFDDYYLSENFCKHHFLIGLMLQQLKMSLNETETIRDMAISTIKYLLAKHESDDRYQDKGRMSRIAYLYIPLLSIILDNCDRFERVDDIVEKKMTCGAGDRGSCLASCSCHPSTNNFTTCKSENANNVVTASNTPIRLSYRCPAPAQPQTESPIKECANIRNSTYLAAIAGHNTVSGASTRNAQADLSTAQQEINNSNARQYTECLESNCDFNDAKKKHSRSSSDATAFVSPRNEDKFQPAEIQNLLICFLFVIKHLEEEQLKVWWQQCSDIEIHKFLSIIELSLHHFKYQGKEQTTMTHRQGSVKPKSTKSMTLPARITPLELPNGNDNIASGTLQTQNTTTLGDNSLQNNNGDGSKARRIKVQANLAVEVGFVVLDCLGLFCSHFKDILLEDDRNNLIVQRIVNIYLAFLQIGQSENLLSHVFAAFRSFLNNFSVILFQGNALLCGRLCYELLKCCNSKLNSVRQESCALLYLLMRSNFEFTNRIGLTRVHLQVIISVSQLLRNVMNLNNPRFQESLSLINSYASSDKVMKGTNFLLEVQDLIKRIRTVLMATTQMREHNHDPEMLLDLQYRLANSYASTPELRHTWLETMARSHLERGNYSEAACCQLHISALIAEYLKLKKQSAWGAEAFDKISKNISRDEKDLKFDTGIQDVHYNEQVLLEQLESCTDILDKAERFEILGELYHLIIPMYERDRNYEALAKCYSHLTQAYGKIVQVNKSGKRLLGRFYKVAFYGSVHFEQEHGAEYIYKEPKVTSLSEISERLRDLYSKKFGAESVKIIMDSRDVDVAELNPKIAHIQVTHVTPYFDDVELETRQTEFERNHDVSCFMFETPFTKDCTRSRASPQDQWKRRTILTTQRSFPYVKKRIKIITRKTIELSPIQVALDEMRQQVQELQNVTLKNPVDVKKLQLKLQGSVCVTVNAGPLAYACAFLNPTLRCQYPDDLVLELKDVFGEFVKICYTALQINSKLISCDQYQYQEVLRENYQKFCNNLSSVLGDSVWPDEDANNFKRNSAALFNAISGTTNSHSSTA